MDQILNSQDNVIDEEFNSKSSSRVESDNSFLDCLSPTTVRDHQNSSNDSITANTEFEKSHEIQKQSDDIFTNESCSNVENNEMRCGSDLVGQQMKAVDNVNQVVDECNRLSNKLLNEQEISIDVDKTRKIDDVEPNINLVPSINSQFNVSTSISCGGNSVNSTKMLFHNQPETEKTSFTEINEDMTSSKSKDTNCREIDDPEFSSRDSVCKTDDNEHPETGIISFEVNHSVEEKANIPMDRSEEKVQITSEGDDPEFETALYEDNRSEECVAKIVDDVGRIEVNTTVNHSEENVDKTDEGDSSEMEITSHDVNHREESVAIIDDDISKLGSNIRINRRKENKHITDESDDFEVGISSHEVNHSEENLVKGDGDVAEIEINVANNSREENRDEDRSEERFTKGEDVPETEINTTIHRCEENVDKIDEYNNSEMKIDEQDNNPSVEPSFSDKENEGSPEVESVSSVLNREKENTPEGHGDNNHDHDDVNTETFCEANHSEENVKKQDEGINLNSEKITFNEVNHCKNKEVDYPDYRIGINSSEVNRSQEMLPEDTNRNDGKMEITSEVDHSEESIDKVAEDANIKTQIITFTKVNPSGENISADAAESSDSHDLCNKFNEGSTDDVLQNQNTAELNEENEVSSSCAESFPNCSNGKETTEPNLVEITSKGNIGKNNNEFSPTIVDIRGACTDVLENTLIDNTISKKPDTNSLLKNKSVNNVLSKTSKLPQINIVSVQGGVKELIHPSDECQEVRMTENVDTIGYNKSAEDQHRGPSCNANNTIKQEPQDFCIDDDCTYTATEPASTCFTSEIFIKEEKSPNVENAESDVIYIESSSKIPLPIPIKTEAHIEKETRSISANSVVEKPEKRISQPVVMVSSGSEREDSSDSRERSKPMRKCIYSYSSAGYTCHLCNTTFQEHELLNEHMILHRNNSLIQTKAKNGTKQKPKTFPCQKCSKRLSTWQSLQQHLMIHNNEKPHVCSVCNKDFRHLSNYKMHIQKHEEERPRYKERERLKDVPKVDKSVARAVDFGRLVGPLFMKETLLNQKNKEVDVKKTIQSKSMLVNKNTPSPRLSFDKPSFRIKDNTKENVTKTQPTTITTSKKDVASVKTIEQVEEESVPLKTFKNVENIVMNAARFIVKLDNLDANLLKRKIKTPDISIGRNVEKKRRIVLSQTHVNRNLKLDQIENIIMDVTPGEVGESSLVADDTLDRDHGNARSIDDDRERIKTTSKSKPTIASPTNCQPLHGTLTDNELFELLNDGRETLDEIPTRGYEAELRENAKKIMQRESENATKNMKCDKIVATKTPCQTAVSPVKTRTSTITLQRNSPAVRQVASKRTIAEPIKTECRHMTSSPAKRMKIGKENERPTPATVAVEASPHEEPVSVVDVDEEWEKYDAFDTAFHKVAVRRLALMLKRAAANDGKLENQYLMGPLFWLKALRRAEQNRIDRNVELPMIVPKSSPLSKRIGNRPVKPDSRRTNDPVKLQIRAECKLKCVLDRVSMMSDLSHLNLIGPLFWKKTLKLAGIRTADDVKTLLNDQLSPLTLNGIRFVEREELRRVRAEKLAVESSSHVDEEAATTTAQVVDSNSSVTDTGQTLNLDDSSERNKLVDGMLNDELLESEKNRDDAGVAGAPSSKDEDTHSSSAKEVISTTSKRELPIVASNKTESGNASDTKTDSILYESLTKPREASADKLKSVVESTFMGEMKSAEVEAESTKKTTDEPSSSSVSKLANVETFKNRDAEMSDRRETDSSQSCHVVADEKTVTTEKSSVEGANIMLNVDEGIQMIAAQQHDEEKAAETTTAADVQGDGNYVLVSDETGAMQYVVNVPQGENYGNFELNGEQLTFAIQLDGENYSAVQFVQNNAELEGAKSDSGEHVEEEKTNVVADSAHIGKELSDFLNLDYGALIKENAGQGTT